MFENIYLFEQYACNLDNREFVTKYELHFIYLYVFYLKMRFTDILTIYFIVFKKSEYDQEIPQSQTADKPVPSRGRALTWDATKIQVYIV